MATRRAGVITVQFQAGTGQFVGDVEKAKASIRNFGAQARSMQGDLQHGVSGVQATSGALRVLEGGITNNLRAAERFTANILGLGPALQAVFPVVGAVAFLGIFTKLGEESAKFFESIRKAPEAMGGAWRTLNAPLQLTNDELRVAADRLEQQIAKLQGRRENTLQLALDEARLAADRLGQSLDADIQKLHKFLTESDTSAFKKLLTGEPLGSDWGSDPLAKQIGGFTGAGGFNQERADIVARGNAAIAEATDLKAKDAAQVKLQTELLAAYDRQLKSVNAELVKRFEARMGGPLPMPKAEYQITGKEGPEVERALAVRSDLQLQRANVVQNFRVERDTQKRDELGAQAENAKLDRPFEDRMKAMAAQLDGIKAKMAAIGQGEAAEILAKSFADAQKAIEEVNKALEKTHTQLPKFVGPRQADQKPADWDKEGQIRYTQLLITQTEAESAWKSKLDSTTDSIENRIRSQQLLTEAIGKGYEATKKASVETSVMSAVPKGSYGDKEWEAQQSDIPGVTHGQQVTELRKKFGAEYDTQHSEQTSTAVEKLTQQIELEKAVAAVQKDGAEAVRQATLAQRLKIIAQDSAAASAKKLMAAELAKYAAERANVSAGELAKLNEETAATERLTAAVWQGAEASRKAGLENKYTGMQRAGASPEVIQAARTQDEAQNQEQVATEAGKMANSYTDALDRISRLTEKLKEARAVQGDSIGIEIALRDLENQRLKILVDQSLQLRGLKDGVRAFFLEMQTDAQSAAKTLYDAMHSALDKVSNELANLVTGQRTSFAKMFQGIGQELVKSSIKSDLQKVLGQIGKPPAKVGDIDKASGDTVAGTGATRGVGGILPRLIPGWPKQGNVLFGNGGLLGTGKVPTIAGPGAAPGVENKPDGAPSNPLSVVLASNASGPDGSAGNPFYVRMDQSFQTQPIDFGANQVKPPKPPSELSKEMQTGGTKIVADSIEKAMAKLSDALGKKAQKSAEMLQPNSPGASASGSFDPCACFRIIPKKQSSGIAGGVGTFLGGLIRGFAGGGSGSGGGGGGGDTPDVSSTFTPSGDYGGARATGGPVKAGKHYLVGEHGPELFRSGNAGHIIDHETTKKMAAAGMLPAGVKVPGVTAKSNLLMMPKVKSKPFVNAASAPQFLRATGTDHARAFVSPKPLTPRAMGGDVSASQSYLVGENGPEILRGASGRIASNSETRRMLGNTGPTVQIGNIDARGTDAHQVNQAVVRAMKFTHGEAVKTSVQTMNDSTRRRVQR